MSGYRARPPRRRRKRWFANDVSGTLARDLVELADVRPIDDAERLLRLLASQSANLLTGASERASTCITTP